MVKSNSIATRFNDLQTKPEVTFSLHEQPVLHPDKFIDSVKIINKTASPVNNILVRFKMNRNDEYSSWVSCFSLRGDESQELFWMRYPDTIQATYHDLNGRHYFLFTYQDSTSHGMVEEISEQQYMDFSQQAIANRDNNNVQLRDKFTQFILTSLPLKRGSMDDVMIGYREFITNHIF